MITQNNHPPGLYIHIPFCVKKCDYCDFLSIRAGKEEHRLYVAAALAEMRYWRSALEQNEISTVYFGGGTPSLIGAGLLARLLDGVRSNFAISPGAEITVEVNPGTVSHDFWKSVMIAGVTRVSIGVQALSDRLLAVLGRSHDCDSAIRVVKGAYEAGFENVGMDLIYGVPGQTGDDWAITIEKTQELGPKHLSIYSLSYEEGTPLTTMRESGRVVPATDEEEARMYYHALQVLNAGGFRRYEISNLALQGYESRHNLNYWNYGEYLGIGAGAHSFLEGRRWENAGSVREYIDAPYMRPSVVHAPTSARDRLKEFIMLGLRKAEGIALADIERQWGQDAARNAENTAVRLAEGGFVEMSEGMVRIAERGLFISNDLMAEFF